MIDPKTPSEWQMAVDAAHGAIALDAARQSGLVTGGPKVDVVRCQTILRRGESMGFVPSEDAVERFVQGVEEDFYLNRLGALQ